jgi:cytosine/adenosine deaminase-related metal-dependent hydrolase
MTDDVLPSGTTLLLKGGRVFTPDSNWHDPPQADIAVAGDKIIGIAADYRAEGQGIQTIDARDHLVLPGFVNAHYHSHDVLAKGTLCAAAAISAALHRRSLCAYAARRAGMPALRNDHHSGHADALSL